MYDVSRGTAQPGGSGKAPSRPHSQQVVHDGPKAHLLRFDALPSPLPSTTIRRWRRWGAPTRWAVICPALVSRRGATFIVTLWWRRRPSSAGRAAPVISIRRWRRASATMLILSAPGGHGLTSAVTGRGRINLSIIDRATVACAASCVTLGTRHGKRPEKQYREQGRTQKSASHVLRSSSRFFYGNTF